MRVKAKNLLSGDLIDLAGDNYADPDNGDAEFEFEYVVVSHVERETPDCVLVSFENGRSFGFPTNCRFQVFGRDNALGRLRLNMRFRLNALRSALQCVPTPGQQARGRRGIRQGNNLADALYCLRVAFTGRV